MKRILLALTVFMGPCVALATPNTHCTAATPAIDTAAYATGDYMGAAVLTFSGALNGSTNAGYINSVQVTDKAAQAVDMDLVIFTDDPSSTTLTDNAAFDPADADLTKIAGVINLGSASRFAFSDNGTKFLGSLVLPVVGGRISGAPSTNLYGALVARGAYDGASSSDLTVTICVSQD